MKDLTGLFWEEVFEAEIFDTAVRRPVIIYGGRGLGKTHLLSNLRSRLGVVECVNLDGRRAPEARDCLQRMDPIPPAVMIDNIDSLVTPSVKEEWQIVHDVIVKLGSIVPPSASEKTPIFVATSVIDPMGPLQGRLTSALDPTSALHLLNSYSPFADRLQRFRLDPWAGDWQGRWAEKFSQAFGDCLKSARLEALWRSNILDLSGGHPSLAGPALRLLEDLCERRAVSGDTATPATRAIDPYSIDDTVRVNLRFLIEDHVSRNGLSRVRSAVRRLKFSSDPLEQRSYRQLVEIAGAGVPTGLAEVKVRNILEDEGLIYRAIGSTGQYVFRLPGTLITQEVLENPETIQTDVDIVPGASGEKGELRIRCADGSATHIPLTGTPWKILQALHAAGGFVSTDELRRTVGLRNQRAVQNAIQRLRRELKGHNVGELIDNQYDIGYRLVVSSMRG